MGEQGETSPTCACDGNAADEIESSALPTGDEGFSFEIENDGFIRSIRDRETQSRRFGSTVDESSDFMIIAHVLLLVTIGTVLFVLLNRFLAETGLVPVEQQMKEMGIHKIEATEKDKGN
ncbi:hypothetical protein OsJ_09034 [Oryza sativa Japonica Group]|uniref:Uncharacterized protein n=1 Tax=Oryza sativa subsp. japonica TaxID=39947 RepID=B9F9Z0_ORYSJ|nr:hypothetical protein OsJ_09034 [Oryza sativa Japonica Group]